MRFLFSRISPTTNAIMGKLIMYPPVGPAITLGPPLKFENTGMPVIPSNMYISREIAPFLLPRTAADKKTARVCKVMGAVENGV